MYGNFFTLNARFWGMSLSLLQVPPEILKNLFQRKSLALAIAENTVFMGWAFLSA